MKGHRGHFESKSGNNQYHCNIQQRRSLIVLSRVQLKKNLVQVRRTGDAVQVTESEQQERRTHSAEQVILHRSFSAFGGSLCERREDIKSEAQQFKTDEDPEQVLRRRNQQTTCSSHQYDRDVLAR